MRLRTVTGHSQTSSRINASCAGPVKRSINAPGSCAWGTGGMNRAHPQRHSGVSGNCSRHQCRQRATVRRATPSASRWSLILVEKRLSHSGRLFKVAEGDQLPSIVHLDQIGGEGHQDR